jgi:hypothetical protein
MSEVRTHHEKLMGHEQAMLTVVRLGSESQVTVRDGLIIPRGGPLIPWPAVSSNGELYGGQAFSQIDNTKVT